LSAPVASYRTYCCEGIAFPGRHRAAVKVKALIEAFKFPVDACGMQRVAAWAEWIAGKPLETHGIVAN